MHQMDQKKLLIERILPHLTGAPADAVQRLLQKSVSDLETILDDAITKRARAQAAEQVKQQADEMRRESQLEGAWTHALRNVWLNGKQRLVDVESNRRMMESLIQPHEMPSAALYGTIALSYPTKFSWQTPQPKQTDADRQAEFQKICRENSLSECVANQQLHKEGVTLDAWAGASGLERAKFQEEAAKARQKWLVHASPSVLKTEAAYESQTNREAAQREESERSHKFVMSQQSHYPPLPLVNAAGETIDAKYLRKISTIDYPLFKKLVQKHGSGNLTARFRNEN